MKLGPGIEGRDAPDAVWCDDDPAGVAAAAEENELCPVKPPSASLWNALLRPISVRRYARRCSYRRRSRGSQFDRASVRVSILFKLQWAARVTDRAVAGRLAHGRGFYGGTGSGWERPSPLRLGAEWLLWMGEAVSLYRRGWKHVYQLAAEVMPAAVLAHDLDRPRPAGLTRAQSGRPAQRFRVGLGNSIGT